MKNVSHFLRFFFVLCFCVLTTAKANGQCTNPTTDSLDVIVIWEVGAPVSTYLTAFSGRQLDYSAPSNSRLIRIPYCHQDVVINGAHYSYSGMNGAVGVIHAELGSVSTGENFIVSIPAGDVQEGTSPVPLPLPTNLFGCTATQPTATMTSRVTCVKGVNTVKLAILDSGIDEKNNPLMAKVDYKSDILYGTSSVQDSNGHGSNLGGIAHRYLDDNLTMQIYKVLDKTGKGRVWHLLKAIDAAVSNGSKIISISIVGYPLATAANTSSARTPLSTVISNAALQNVIIVAAAGNSGLNIDNVVNHVIPAGEPNDNIISVGSLIGCNNLGTPSSFSNWGQSEVDIFTYGQNILTWNNLGEVESVTGTSYSTVLTACVALQLWTNVPPANRNYESLRYALLNSTIYQTSLATKCQSQGILNAPNARCQLLNNCVVLPVELTSFLAHNTGDKVHLDWTVASEQQINSYEIERSNDGKTFVQIGAQKAQGSTQYATYFYQDNAPVNGTNYYRLKIIEANGVFSYSKTISIVLYAKNEYGLKIYPNPFRTELNVNWQGVKTRNSISIKLMDIVGRVLWSSEVKNTEGGINHTLIPIQKLPLGVYWLQVDNQPIQKLIKQ
jgi:hypothetical protein